jgi:1,4-alpha-glucan branching enzyme
VIVVNFTPVPRWQYRVGVPFPGDYSELINSDVAAYGGSNLGNFGRVHAQGEPCHGRPFSVELTLPPLSAVFLKASRSA